MLCSGHWSSLRCGGARRITFPARFFCGLVVDSGRSGHSPERGDFERAWNEKMKVLWFWLGRAAEVPTA